jgi:MFS family permease
MAIVAPLSGIVADRVGARLPATVGVLIQGVALFWFTMLKPDTPYQTIAMGLALMGLGGGMFFSPNTSAAMNAAPRNRLGIASAALATLRQTGMVTSLALAMAVAAGSLPRGDMMKLFVGTNIAMGSASMQSFVVGMRGAFMVSLGLSLVAALFSFIRGKEDRKPSAS